MEERTARNWYWWLWLSPLVVVPTLSVFGFFFGFILQGSQEDNVTLEQVAYRLAIVGSSLWHLILLVPALNKKSAFVRWHGRQALLLSGVRTALPLAFVGLISRSTDRDLTLAASSVLIGIWFFGTLLGQTQAARGKCSLMQWFGQAEAQPYRLRAEESTQEEDADALVEVIRYSRDPDERAQALSKLRELGMVEAL